MSAKFKEAQQTNWMLMQLEGMKGQLKHLGYSNSYKGRNAWLLADYLNKAREEIEGAIFLIRLQNLAKTGKPPRSVQKEIKMYREEMPDTPLPARLQIYVDTENKS